MKIIDKIIQQSYAPEDKSVLWYDGQNLKINRSGKWESIIKNNATGDTAIIDSLYSAGLNEDFNEDFSI
jgi:hypothetical protein